MRKQLLALALILTSVVAHGQEVSVGAMAQQASSAHLAVVPPPTVLIDLSSPAAAAGTLNTASVYWAATAGCTASFKLRFFRKNFTTGTYVAFAERGPFDSANGLLTVTLTPPVPVEERDVIGVVALKEKSACGGVRLINGSGSWLSAIVKSDATSFDLKTSDLRVGFTFIVRASTTGAIHDGTLVVAGSAAGAAGSFFRTSVHLSNPGEGTSKGYLVFHPAGRSAQPNDPRLPFSLPPRTSSYSLDAVAAMGQSGIGSIDVYTNSSFPPIVTARIFDDKGSAGTSGFSEDLLSPSEALQVLGEATFAIPAADFRMNIGVRSLAEGATVLYALYKPDGQIATGIQERTYPANYFEQVSLASIFPASITIPAGGRVTVAINAGSAFVYASATDNRTNDSSIQMARRR